LALFKFLALALMLSACADQEIVPVKSVDSSNSSIDELSESPESRISRHSEGPNYNLNVLLQGEDRTFGFIKFRQYKNESQMIYLDTWVFGLEPNTSYQLQRAVDTTLDGNCTSTAWLTLGKGLEPLSIVTDNRGMGKAEIFRGVATIPVGATFDIHFQIVKENTTEVVLASDCYQYTVR
jgi:hypothetical protein